MAPTVEAQVAGAVYRDSGPRRWRDGDSRRTMTRSGLRIGTHDRPFHSKNLNRSALRVLRSMSLAVSRSVNSQRTVPQRPHSARDRRRAINFCARYPGSASARSASVLFKKMGLFPFSTRIVKSESYLGQVLERLTDIYKGFGPGSWDLRAGLQALRRISELQHRIIGSQPAKVGVEGSNPFARSNTYLTSQTRKFCPG